MYNVCNTLDIVLTMEKKDLEQLIYGKKTYTYLGNNKTGKIFLSKKNSFLDTKKKRGLQIKPWGSWLALYYLLLEPEYLVTGKTIPLYKLIMISRGWPSCNWRDHVYDENGRKLNLNLFR